MRILIVVPLSAMLAGCALNWRGSTPHSTIASSKQPSDIASCLVNALDAGWERRRTLPWDTVQHHVRTIDPGKVFEVAPINDLGDDFIRVTGLPEGGSKIEVAGPRWRFFDGEIRGCA